MSRRQISLLAAVLFFTTAGVWFFNGERIFALVFAAIGFAMLAVSISKQE